MDFYKKEKYFWNNNVSENKEKRDGKRKNCGTFYERD